MSGGPYRHYPPGGFSRNPLPAYTRQENPNVTLDLKPEGNNDDAFARLAGFRAGDAPLKAADMDRLKERVRSAGIRWKWSHLAQGWYRDDEPTRKFDREVDLLLDAARRIT